MSGLAVRVVPEVLSDFESRLRNLPISADVASRYDFSAAPPVQQAYSDLAGKWKKSRQEVKESLTGLADAVRDIREAFVSADNETAQLAQGG